MNRTKIKWTAALSDAQARRNAEREEKVKRQRQIERAKQSVGPLRFTAMPSKERRPFMRGKSPKRPGYVYVICVKDVHKIGLTENFTQRIQALKADYRFRKYRLVALLEVPNMLAVEAELHRAFADRRVGGEWFRLTADDLAVIEQIARHFA